MNSTLLATAAAALFVSTAAHAAITTLLTDSFDTYTSDAKLSLAWTPDSTTDTVTTDKAFSGSQSVSAGLGAQRNYKAFTATTATPDHPIDFSFEFYDTAGAAMAYRESGEIDNGTTSTDAGQVIAMGLTATSSTNYMAKVLGYNGDAYFKLNGAGAPSRVTGWHKLEVIDYGSTLDFYVDNIKSFTVTGVTVVPLGFVKLGSNQSSTQNAYFDDVSVRVLDLPEPIAIGGVGLLSLLSLRQRRR